MTAARATLAELDLLERERVLVDAEAVRGQMFSVNRVLRNNLQSIPDRISAIVAAEANAAACHKLIYNEVIRSLNAAADGLAALQVDEGSADITRRVASKQLADSVSQETVGKG